MATGNPRETKTFDNLFRLFSAWYVSLPLAIISAVTMMVFVYALANFIVHGVICGETVTLTLIAPLRNDASPHGWAEDLLRSLAAPLALSSALVILSAILSALLFESKASRPRILFYGLLGLISYVIVEWVALKGFKAPIYYTSIVWSLYFTCINYFAVLIAPIASITGGVIYGVLRRLRFRD